MRFFKIILLPSLLLVCFTAIAEPVPHLINYQGKLTGADGNPLPTADYSLSFEIFNQASDGTTVWGPQVFDGQAGQGHGAKVPVVQGYFNVILGPEDTAGRSIVNAFASADAYLQISVNGDLPILPRQQVLSAPYAVSSLTALHGDPVGSIQAFFGLNAPEGWLICNGQVIDKINHPAYSALVEHLRNSTNQIGSDSYQVSEDSNKARLPDLRGMFLRGFDAEGNTDPNRTLGDYQEDMVAAHKHEFEDYTFSESSGGNWGWRGNAKSDHDNGPTNPWKHDTYEYGGNETRPKNIAVNFIIKY